MAGYGERWQELIGGELHCMGWGYCVIILNEIINYLCQVKERSVR
jgi:hypothetical protein